MSQETFILAPADLRILKRLRGNGRMSWVELGRRVNLSASACQRRVEAMVAAGVIARFTVDLDATAMGLGVHAFVQIKVERQMVERAKALRATIASYPEVEGAWKLSGVVDYLVEARVRGIAELSAFIDEKLLALDGVVDATSSIVLEEVA